MLFGHFSCPSLRMFMLVTDCGSAILPISIIIQQSIQFNLKIMKTKRDSLKLWFIINKISSTQSFKLHYNNDIYVRRLFVLRSSKELTHKASFTSSFPLAFCFVEMIAIILPLFQCFFFSFHFHFPITTTINEEQSVQSVITSLTFCAICNISFHI